MKVQFYLYDFFKFKRWKKKGKYVSLETSTKYLDN